MARELGLWPPPRGSILETVDTVGGGVLGYIIPNSVELAVVEEDRNSKLVVCNAIITLHEDEVLLSDAVIEELGIEMIEIEMIEILSLRTGLWRFNGGR